MSFIISHDFIKGAIAMGLLIGAGFFVRFWRETHDRLFVFFAVAFLMMAINRSLVTEDTLWPFALRLVAYTIILIAIVDKNLRRT